MDFIGNAQKLLKERMNRVNPGASIFRAPEAKNRDWLGESLDRAREAGLARQKKEQDDERRREEARLLQQQQRKVETATDTARKMQDPVWRWAHSAEGNQFLSSGGAKKVDYNALARNPLEYLAKNDTFREFRWGFEGELEGRVPPEVTQRIREYAQTDEGIKHFKNIGTRDYGFGPTDSLKEKNQIVGTLAEYGLGAVPVVGAAIHGANPGSDDPTSGGLWADALGAVGNRLVMGRGVNAIENAAATNMAGRFGLAAADDAGKVVLKPGAQAAAARLGLKAATRGGMNLAEDVPLSAAQMTLDGVDVESGAFWKNLAMQGGMSFGAGAAIPVAGAAGGAGVRATAKAAAAPGAREIIEAGGAGATAYAAARMAGKDHEDAAKIAAVAAALPFAARMGAKGMERANPQAAQMVRTQPGDKYFHGTAEPFEGMPLPVGRENLFGDNVVYTAPNRGIADAYQRVGDGGYPRTFEMEPRQAGELFDRQGILEPGEAERIVRATFGSDDAAAREFLDNFNRDYTHQTGNNLLLAIGDLADDPRFLDMDIPVHHDAQNELLQFAGYKGVVNEPGANVTWFDPLDDLEVKNVHWGDEAARKRLDEMIESGEIDDLSADWLHRSGGATRNPAVQQAAQTAGVAGFAAATTDGDAGDRAEAAGEAAALSIFRGGITGAARLALKSQAADFAVMGITKHSDPTDYKIGGKVYNATNGKELGEVLGLEGDRLRIKTPTGLEKTVPLKHSLNATDYNANVKELKLAAAVAPVTPSPANVAAKSSQMAEAVKLAEAATDTPRILTRLAEKAGLGWLDPATRFKTNAQKEVLNAALAGANVIRAEAPNGLVHVRNLLDILKPLRQESGPRFDKGFIDVSLRDAARAGAQVGAFGAPAAAGYVAGEATGIDEFKEAGVIAGAVALGATSHAQGKGFMKDMPWERFQLNLDDPGMPSQLASGKHKLVDIIERPDAYNLPDNIRTAIDQYRKARETYLRQTNESLIAAGQDPVPLLDGNALFHWFTPDSVDKARIGAGPSATEIASPGFARQLPLEHQRKLGETYYEALSKHPDLKIAGDIEALLKEEAQMHARLRGNAVLVNALKNSGSTFKIDSADALRAQGKTPAEITAYNEKVRKLREDQKWSGVPGIDDHIFAPDVVEAVSDLLVLSRGSDNVIMNGLDDITNSIRQAMFVGDLSAWTMQGAMSFIENPFAVLRNAHHLIGATAFGNRYFEWWLSKPDNARLYDEFSRSSGVAGRQFEGLELTTSDTKIGHAVSRASIANKPGFKHIESRGFESFLPIQRVLMWDNMRKQNALIAKFGPGHELGRALVEGAQYAPTVGAAVAVATGNELDVPGLNEDWDKMFTLALGVAGSTGMRSAIQTEGGAALDNMNRADRRKLETRSAKMTNRLSGNLNRQVLGMSNSQAQVERTFLARSPALMRNAISLAKLAATDVGPDGALARLYLIKTAALIGVGLAAAKWAQSGEWDSFDPNDPDSVFSPEGFMRAGLGSVGKGSASNPVVALMRAALHQETPAGETRWSKDNWRPDIGAKNWLEGRLPDVTGMVTDELLDVLPSGIPDPEGDERTIGDKLKEGDFGAAVAAVGSKMAPLTVQKTLESGALDETAIGDRLGLEGNPNYNNATEKVAGILGAFIGLNVNPETLGQESTRRRNAVREELFPDVPDRNGDGRLNYEDLNSEQTGAVREALNKDESYSRLTTALDEQNQTEEPRPIQRYLDRNTAIHEEYKNALIEADAEYQMTKDAFTFKERYQQLQEEKRIKLEEARVDLGGATAGMRGRSETVEEWLERNVKPEDKAVSDYYDLFDAATKNGKLNFPALEEMQAEYIAKLDPEIRDYVTRRIDSFDKPTDIPALAEYQKAKDAASPYFQLREDLFTRIAAKDSTLAQFKNRQEFEEAVAVLAGENGISPDAAMAALAKHNPYIKLYQEMVQLQGGQMRMADRELDTTLTDWFGYSPKHPGNQMEQSIGELRAVANMRNMRRDRNKFSAADYGR